MASSSKQAQHLDEVRYRFEDGPCLRAAREKTVFYIQDTSDDERFGNYLAPVVTHGIRSILAIPIPLAGTAQAALNLYATEPAAFDGSASVRAGLFAREASKSLRLMVRIAALAESNANLKAALTRVPR
jgi:GAF domain-containing protein